MRQNLHAQQASIYESVDVDLKDREREWVFPKHDQYSVFSDWVSWSLAKFVKAAIGLEKNESLLRWIRESDEFVKVGANESMSARPLFNLYMSGWYATRALLSCRNLHNLRHPCLDIF